jgi:hypothetical protein
MKGIYITLEGKAEIESRIAILENYKRDLGGLISSYEYQRMIDVYQSIVNSSPILSIEKSWDDVEFCYEYALEDLQEKYPHGVIIQNKKQ